MIPIRGLRAPVPFTPHPVEMPTEPPPRPVVRLVLPTSANPTAREIIAQVARMIDVDLVDLTGRPRATKCVLGRSVAIRLLRDRKRSTGEHSYSMTQIGRLLGGRDHSTISHALDTFDARMTAHPDALAIYELLRT